MAHLFNSLLASVWFLILPCLCRSESDAAGESEPARQLMSRRLSTPRRLGTCDDLQKGTYSDVTGWHCDADVSKGSRALYCDCKYERRLSKAASAVKSVSKKKKHETKWECEKKQEEMCTYGSPACHWGRCKDSSSACGTTWATELTKTCAQVFTKAAHSADLTACVARFGTAQICPVTALGAGYLSWANKMENATQVDVMLQTAAMDVDWFYKKFASLVDINGTMPTSLATTSISKHFHVFQKFSCHRNLPQCKSDFAYTTKCEASCNEVTAAVTTFLKECNALKAANTTEIEECHLLDYVRDCDGTKAAVAGDWPGLCTAFQNQVKTAQVSAAARASSFLCLLLIMLGGQFYR